MPYGSGAYGQAPYGSDPGSKPSAVLTANLGLSASASGPVAGTATLTGTVALTANPAQAISGNATLTATLALTATANGPVAGTATLRATLGLTAGHTPVGGAATLAATLTVNAVPDVEATPLVYSPIGAAHTIRYWVTGQDGTVFAELPFTNVTFTKCFNQSGPFSATLNIEDQQVLNTNWITGTNPGKTCFWVLIDNKLVYGGRILGRTYQMSAQQVTITGSDFYGYWAQRLQAADYTNYTQNYSSSLHTETYNWAKKSGGAPTPMIAWQLLQDAVNVAGSFGCLTAPFHGEGPGLNSDPDTWIGSYPADQFITFSAPISQQQTIDSMLQQMIGMGLGIGVDIVTTVKLVNGIPTARVNVAWPRFGQTAAQLGKQLPVLDLSNAIDLEWNEDATAQANALVEQTGANGVQSNDKQIDSTAIDTYNYPLLEQAISHTSMSPNGTSDAVLNTLYQGDRDLYAYPQLAPVVTVPLFNEGTGFSITSLPLGNDVAVSSMFERQTQYGLPTIPFPPASSEIADGTQWLRLVRADVTIADDGVSTMDLTLNQPPGSPAPAGYNI